MFKITLDRQALEYLWNIGGDNFQLELKSAVIQWFSNKFLKGIITTEVYDKAVDFIRNEITLTNDQIKRYIDVELKKLVDERVNGTEEYEQEQFARKVPNLTMKIRHELNALVQDEIRERIHAMDIQTIIKEIATTEIENRLKRKLVQALND